jgi:hypothetical protein
VIPAHLLVHTASVEPYQGSGAYGDVYGAAVNVPCFYEGVRRLVRDSDGTEVVSEATIYVNPGVDVPSGSRVTVNGYASTVISVSDLDDGGLTGLAHKEVALA